MADWNLEITKIVLDKGLFALILALVAAYFSRSLEKLKSALSWNGELLKRRLDLSLSAKHQMQQIEEIYVNVLGEKYLPGTGSDPTALFKPLKELEDTSLALSILQADRATIDAIEDFSKQAAIAIDVHFQDSASIAFEDDRPVIRQDGIKAGGEMMELFKSLKEKRSVAVLSLKDAFGLR